MTDQNCPQDGGMGDGFLDAEAMAHELTKRLQRLDEEAAQYSAAAGHLEESRKSSDRLVEEGETRDSPAFRAKVQAYASREPAMRKARIEPDFPQWPNACFYPMNKKRKVGENWFLLDFAERSRLMAEHGRTGMTFGGRVSQLITVSVGLDDWEWGVTLWAKRPDFLKEIVYTMRFDEASARYAEFGPFYTGYVATAAEILDRCGLA